MTEKLKPKYNMRFKYTDDESDTFEIHVRCGNCWGDYGVRVKKGTKVQNSHLKFLKCKNCEIVGMLFRVGWDGKVYTKLEKLK